MRRVIPILAIVFTLFYANSSAYAQQYVSGEVIIKYKKQDKFSAQSFSQGAVSKAMSAQKIALKKSWSHLNMQQVSAKAGQSTDALIQELSNDPNVEYVEPNYILGKMAMEAQSVQTYSSGEIQTFSGSFGLTGAPIQGVDAWSEITASGDTVVAIIDTGVDLNHEVLADAMWINSDEIDGNGIDDDGNGFIDDRYGWNFVNNNNNPNDCDGHGTHVAGIVRGTTQYLFANPLATPTIKIMPLKFLDCYGYGTTADAIQAIYYAVNNGAKVLNNSWGGGGYSQSLHEAITYSYNAKTVFVAAAGNSANNNDSNPLFPATYDVPNVVSVGASTDSDYLAGFSNYGFSTVDIAAPGVAILSSYPNDSYTFLSGTSMAAPIAAGVLALMANENPTMNGYQLRDLLLTSADTVTQFSNKINQNRRLNSNSAIIAAKNTTASSYMPGYDISSSAYRGLASSSTSSTGGGCGLVYTLGKNGSGGGGPKGPLPPTLMIILAAISAPFVFVLLMRRKIAKQKRRYERLNVQSSIKLQVGNKELTANLNSVSAGGMGFATSEALQASGGKIKVVIEGPDGKESIEVSGQVVWQNTTNGYGLAFDKPKHTLIDTLKLWGASLAPAPYKK